MIDSHLLSLTKAVTWRLLVAFFTVTIGYLLTHKIMVAIYIGAFEFVSKIVFFYIHERLWIWIERYWPQKSQPST